MNTYHYVSIMLHNFGLSLTSRKKVRAGSFQTDILKRFEKSRLNKFLFFLFSSPSPSCHYVCGHPQTWALFWVSIFKSSFRVFLSPFSTFATLPSVSMFASLVWPISMHWYGLEVRAGSFQTNISWNLRHIASLEKIQAKPYSHVA